MKITIVAAGKIKEKYLTAGINEFLKRLTPFATVKIVEINEEKMKDNPSEAEKKQVQMMVQTILKLEKMPKLDDTADALAIAICHAHTGASRIKGYYNVK